MKMSKNSGGKDVPIFKIGAGSDAPQNFEVDRLP
jgi:hypothetical protein